ncbi:hypothetical protein DFH07DRAFT_768895 [Mycena maculata]|uniref:Uncharacterized protein n=1 Tax=Mycena maculata TaxID=230809 RepID=A0AAD7NPE9_9AGAR|nr:hypothetical protein DFH07DRAFT_768895 [Mycena maculata]
MSTVHSKLARTAPIFVYTRPETGSSLLQDVDRVASETVPVNEMLPAASTMLDKTGACCSKLPVESLTSEVVPGDASLPAIVDSITGVENDMSAFDPNREYDAFIRDLDPVPRPTIDESKWATNILERECKEVLNATMIRSECALAELLPFYYEDRHPLAGDNPRKDLEALHSCHFLRRSSRIKAQCSETARTSFIEDEPSTSCTKTTASNKRTRDEIEADPSQPNKQKWWDKNELVIPNGDWHKRKRTLPQNSVILPPLTAASCNQPRKKPARRGRRPDDHQLRRTMARAEFLSAKGFSIQKDASVSKTGWSGAAPPKLARSEIDRRYFSQENARGLHSVLSRFYPASYKICPNIRDERATLFVDNAGIIFMFRTYRLAFLQEAASEIEYAHNVLVSSDLDSPRLQFSCKEGTRGPHMPIIIGHYRQSASQPRVTAWHKHNQPRVDTFMDLDIVKRIIVSGVVTSVVKTVFPGVAARFEADAKWHKDRYGIDPMFGLFWNLCLNAWFPNARRVHCKPHADKKNQIGICVLLIYVLKSGKNFNHTKRTWLVIWEAGVVLELPPWVLAMYPSSLLYHFNVDVHDILFLTTEGDVRPTPENSRPLVEGDDCGRGSFVFFNQSTMRHGPELGFDTKAEAELHGVSGTIDYGKSAQQAFERYVVFKPLPTEIVS